MANIELLPHNEEALEKLNKCLETNQMASINHATGTGKSFIILKYLYNNRDKRILYIAPTYPILEQLTQDHMSELGISKSDFSRFDTLIYMSLTRMNMEEIASNYDIIILDEYHRSGALYWGKKVKELLRIIKEKYPNKKVVGMTATEVRYLDHNRDMNQILFNGVEASRLTLADAILKGLLPVPVYLNYNYSLLKNIYELESNINKYAFYSDDINESLSHVRKVKSQIEEILYSSDDIKKILKEFKKVLVFSNNIKSIYHDEGLINAFLGKVDNEYIVHSSKTHEANAKALKEFSNQDDSKKSALYSVNILNEGVHVKSVDAIFMLRRTTSPIIYFQQLGRLLSFSKRNSKVVVVDLVNNIRNNKIIYELYSEVISRAKELLKTDPENSDRYNNIIDSFVIIDKAVQLYDVIDNLEKKYSKNSIIVRRLETAVSILEGNRESTEIEKIMAHIDIIKYEKYITLELFDRIKELNINHKPSILQYSKEEFMQYLNGSININSKKGDFNNITYQQTIDFYDDNDRLPSIFSENEEEASLAKKVYENYNALGMMFKNYLNVNITPELSLLEKVSYDTQLKDIDIEQLTIEAKMAIEKGIKISPYVSYLITNKHSISDELLEKIELNTQTDYEEALVISSKNDAFDTVAYTIDFDEAAADVNKMIENSSYNEVVDKIYEELSKFIKEHKRDIRFNDVNKNERMLYCKKILLLSALEKKGYLKELEELVLSVQKKMILDYNENIVKLLVEFMLTHNGALPSAKNKDSDEIELAKTYLKNKSSVDIILRDKIEEIKEKFPGEKNRVFNEYINFIKENNRRPLIAKVSEEEIELCKNFNRWQSSFTEEEKEELNDALSSFSKYDEISRIYHVIKQKKKY